MSTDVRTDFRFQNSDIQAHIDDNSLRPSVYTNHKGMNKTTCTSGQGVYLTTMQVQYK